jgi:copper homeostasis protein
VIETGADRILTSGGKPTAVEGAETLRSLVELAKGSVIVMACGGIGAENVRVAIEKTGVREVHVGLRTPMASPMRYRNENIAMGTVRGSEYQRFIVREDNVARLVHAASVERG